MSRRRVILLLAYLLVITSQAFTVGHAQQSELPSIEMFPIEDAGDGRSSVDGGTRQNSASWPATLKYTLSDQFTCTSTIVGEKTIITAAHCLRDGAIASIRFAKDGVSVKLHCVHHDLYQRTGLINDIALCLSDSAFPKRFKYEKSGHAERTSCHKG